MPIFGALAGLTAAGLYAAVDEIRVAHKIHSHQLSGSLIALMDYKVNDARFDGIIRRFENDWTLDGGSLYPKKLVGFFAENPNARQQWIRMQASILLHDAMERRSCENDTKMFGNEAIEYERLYGDVEREYICQHSEKARQAIKQYEQEYRDHINSLVKKDKTDRKTAIISAVVGVVLIVALIIFAFGGRSSSISCISAANPQESDLSTVIMYALLSLGVGSITYGLAKLFYRKRPLLWALGMGLFAILYPVMCHS
ncbi:MAG: hypothetical protein IKZ44_08975 [Clostridia bacterium]|nr:hypothetical protein [Clostridia bacterium]